VLLPLSQDSRDAWAVMRIVAADLVNTRLLPRRYETAFEDYSFLGTEEYSAEAAVRALFWRPMAEGPAVAASRCRYIRALLPQRHGHP